MNCMIWYILYECVYFYKFVSTCITMCNYRCVNEYVSCIFMTM